LKQIAAIDDHRQRFASELRFIDPKHNPFWGHDIVADTDPKFWPYSHIPVLSIKETA
jgi:hypothetical protein